MGFRIIAYKCGMTRFFTPEGISIPITVIKIYDNHIIDIKKINNDYSSVKKQELIHVNILKIFQ